MILEIFLFGCCENSTTINQSRLDVYWAHEPNGNSCKDIAHYAQAIQTGTNQMYDYGQEGNLQHYNQTTPPAYDVTQIPDSIPIALYSGGNDVLADPLDVLHLASLLGKKLVSWNIQPYFGHMDFVWGLKAPTHVYPSIIELIRKYHTN